MQDEKQASETPVADQEVVPAQVPRRFPVGTMLAFTAIFAVVLSILRTAGVPPIGIVVVGGWVIVIGLAQAVLFKGKRPRAASMWAGATLSCIAPLVGAAIAAYHSPGIGRFMEAVAGGICAMFPVAAVGAAMGYVTGCGLAGVFLVIDRIRTGQWNEIREVAVPAIVVPPYTTWQGGGRPQPILETERLRLRPFEVTDAAEVQRLAGDAEVASTTLRIPHPYEDGMAEAWISSHGEQYRKGEEVHFAIVRKADEQLLGAVGLVLHVDQAKAELGYWIGRPYWNQGYATEAAAAVLRYGFQEIGMVSIFAHHLVRNPASGRVMQKIGMRHTGKLRQMFERDGVREDCEGYEVMRYEWEDGKRS